MAIARGAVFIATLQAAGVALFLTLFGRHVPSAVRAVGRFGYYAAAAAAVFVLLRIALEPVRMAGALSGAFDPFLWSLFWQSAVSTTQIVRLAGLLLIFVSLLRGTALAAVGQLIGAALVVLSFTLMGHTRVHAGSLPLGVLLAIHIAIVVFWFGALVPLLVCLRIESPQRLSDALRAFSRLATRLVPGLLAAGLLLAWVLLSSIADLLTPYGLLLIGKLGAFAGLSGLAALNKYRLTVAVAAGEPGAHLYLRRSIIAEIAVMVVVFMLTAIMTTLYSPN